MVRKGGYEWLVKVAGGRLWVFMDAYGCIGVGEHVKQACKGYAWSNTHDFPATMTGKFPKIHTCVWAVRIGTEWYVCVFGGFSTIQWDKISHTMHRNGHVEALGVCGGWILARMSRREKCKKQKQNNCVYGHRGTCMRAGGFAMMYWGALLKGKHREGHVWAWGNLYHRVLARTITEAIMRQ